MVAAELAGRGYDVAICSRHLDQARQGAEVAQQRAAAGEPAAGRIVATRCDVSDRQAVRDVVRQVEAELGPVEVLLHVAGITQAACHGYRC